jgi:cytoskeletal protein CcmA (bactofilin family)
MGTSRVKFVLPLAAGSLIAAVAAVALAQQSDKVLLIEQPVSHDIYAAHREVTVRTTIAGDLVAAGQHVVVDGEVTGDVIVAAQNIEIRGAVSDDVRASGQHVRITAPVAGHIVAAGQSVTVDQEVGDWAWLVGSTVEVQGDVGGDLKILAKTTDINSEVDGNVEVTGDELRLGPSAIVRGDLRWRSDNEAAINSGAQIDGEFIKEPLPDYADDLDSGDGIIFTLGLIIAVMALFLLFSRPLQTSADRIAARPGISLALGFVVLVSTPILALILLISGFGAWLGLAILGVYLAVLLIGVLAGLFAVSDLALRKLRPKPSIWQALAAIIVTVVAVGLLTNVPYLGTIVVLLIWLLGVGSICWLSWVALHSDRDDLLQQS